jgi:hypothetical protein
MLKDVVVSLNREQIDTLREDWGPSPKRCLRDCHKGWYKHRGQFMQSHGFFYHLLGKSATVIGKCSGGGSHNLVHSEFEGEDWGIGVLNYEDGTQVVVEGNYATRGGKDDFVEIYGSAGVIKADRIKMSSAIDRLDSPGASRCHSKY